MTLRVHPDEIVERSSSPLLAIHPSWARVRLGHVADVLNGFAFKSEFFSRNGGIPLLRIRDVGRSTTDTSYSGEYDPRYVVNPGDIVVGMDGDFRVARWSGAEALLNQRVCKITVSPPKSYEPSFLLHVLPAYLDAINAQTSSVTVKHLSSRTVEEVPIPLPPLAEQRRIVGALEEQFSRLDAADALLARGRAHLRTLRSATLRAAFNESWPTVRIADVAYVGSGATPKRDNAEYWNGGTIPWVTSGQLTQPFVNEPAALITEKALKETNVKLWPKHTLLVALYGEGKTRGHCSELLIESTTNQACAAVVLRDESVNRAYLKLFFAASYDANRRMASGGVQPNLSLTLIKGLRFPLPPPVEQQRVVDHLAQQLSLGESLRDSLATASRRSSSLRRSILERAFRGELVPQDPDDEPASVLLERILTGQTRAVTRQRRTVIA